MSHISHKKRGWIPCEFASMGDCPSDSDYCQTYKDPDDCEKYHRKMVAEGEESQKEFESRLADKQIPENSDAKSRLSTLSQVNRHKPVSCANPREGESRDKSVVDEHVEKVES
jgi:hypothetical protein